MTSIRSVLDHFERNEREEDFLAEGAELDSPVTFDDERDLELDSDEPPPAVSSDSANKYKTRQARDREQRLASDTCQHEWIGAGPNKAGGYRWRCKKCPRYTATECRDVRPRRNAETPDPGVSPNRAHVGTTSERNQQQH